MPRIENTGTNVTDWCDETGEGSSTYDLCSGCAEVLDVDPHAHDAELEPYNGDPHGDDGWSAGCCHPDYADEDYLCEVCMEPLTSADD